MATPKKRRTKTPRTPTKTEAQDAPQDASQGESTEAPSPSASAGSLSFEIEGISYSLDKPPRKNGRRSVVTVKLSGSENAKPFVDRVDLFSFRSRHAFAGLVADVFGRQAGDILGHLAVVLDEVERNEAKANKPVVPVLTPCRTKAAEKLLASKNLLDRAAKALEDLGYVGEERNKRLGYLVATSRLLTKPLSAILMAPSGSGKSELLDKLALLLPEESVEFLSRLTPAALYYLGPDHLQHKLVLVDEQAGASEADYPIRTLQSKGLLRLAATVKGKTEPFTVNGPIALMSGTTDQSINPENLSRCLELSLDDSKEQTRLIQEAQRRAWAGEKKKLDTEVWQDAQRLLEPLEVVIPFATKLDYPTRTTKDRRDNAKLLTLIATHALLVQRLRKRDREGKLLATVEDYQVVYDLLRPQVDAELDGLSPRAATLYRKLLDRDRVPFTRREAAESLGWSYMTTKRALDELVAHELVYLSDQEYVRSYQLLESSVIGNTARLKKPSEIKAK
jgi:DNA primase